MVRQFPYQVPQNVHSLPILSIGIFISIFALVALCAKRGSKSPRSRFDNDLYEQEAMKKANNGYKTPPRSPLATPKKFLSNISNMKPSYNKNNNNKNVNMVVDDDDQREGFGEGGLWQKNILMGEKCQPLEFSGVIYYDNYGNKVSQIPRSPRASAASLHGSMSFPVSSRSSSDIM